MYGGVLETRDCCEEAKSVFRLRLAVRFAIDGDLRFISHHDTVRLFERALARAGWPVRFTQGFNPHPRLSLPLPRSVGVAGEDEILIVELTEAMSADEAARRLSPHLPAGMTILGVQELGDHARPRPVRAWYELAMPEWPAELDEAVDRLRRRDELVVTRGPETGKSSRPVDVRPFIDDVARQGDRLRIVLHVTPNGSARPVEVLDALGLNGRQYVHRLRRVRVEWTGMDPTTDDDTDPGRPASADAEGHSDDDAT